MDTKVMKTFCDLVDMASFVRAAEAGNITQSAVSQQLAKLERTFSIQLINRGGGGVEPTEAGSALYEAARDVLARYERMFEEVRTAALGSGGALRVGTIYSVGLYLLQPYIRKFIRAYPTINLMVEYTDAARIMQDLLAGEMDLGVVAYPERHRALQSIPFTKEQLVVVCAPGNPVAKRRRVSPQELAGRRFVALSPPVPTRRFINRALHRAGVAVEVVMEFDNIDTLKRAVEVDAGLSILPRGNIKQEAAAGMLACVPFRDQTKWLRPIALLRRRGKVRTHAERRFLELLRSG